MSYLPPLSFDEFKAETEALLKPPPFVSKYGRLPWSALDEPGPEHDFLIDDFLSIGDRSVIGGPSQSGKSFLAIHAALAVARGTKFFGRKVKKGLVVYQAGEGAHGIKKRLRAYRKAFGVPRDEAVPFELLQSPIDVWRPDGDTVPLIAEIKAISEFYNEPLRLVVIDTLATAIGGADEISGKDMGLVMKNIARINAETGAHVALVHHMNASGTKLRGHTSIYANLDQVILVTRDPETKIRTVSLDKQKDNESGIALRFELQTVQIGEREEDGRPITSCVVNERGEGASPQQAEDDKAGRPHALPDGRLILGDNLTAAMQALQNGLERYGVLPPSDVRAPDGSACITMQQWLDELFRLMPGASEGAEEHLERCRKLRDKSLAAARTRLLAWNDSDWVWRMNRRIASVDKPEAPEPPPHHSEAPSGWDQYMEQSF